MQNLNKNEPNCQQFESTSNSNSTVFNETLLIEVRTVHIFHCNKTKTIPAWPVVYWALQHVTISPGSAVTARVKNHHPSRLTAKRR